MALDRLLKVEAPNIGRQGAAQALVVGLTDLPRMLECEALADIAHVSPCLKANRAGQTTRA